MRLISGALGGRILKTAEGEGYRPATAKVRGAIFSMLESRGMVWNGSRILDLFAGSGSLAFEALSRGAEEASMVELADLAILCLEQNASSLGVQNRCRIIQTDVRRFLRGRVRQYDVIFVDPPYGKDLLKPTFQSLVRNDWLMPGGFLIAELESVLNYVPQNSGGLEPVIDRLYGQTRIIIWEKKNA
ncbi:MAG: 16S rRNA (guanine(966)-N(2))-methyltransferase RsmD [Desulfovibrionaceae bacterium]|nr:16S rRNA (guanine(966)-N(2))-methyltransferase RsmD [Desulfovibrionaceae bacterium]